MSEEKIMVPIPYRHIKDLVKKWVDEQFPQLRGKVTDISFVPVGIQVTYLKD